MATVDGSVGLSPYRYDELPNAATHIRLIEVLEAAVDGLIRCRLTTWPIASAPKYTAISYTWGDPTTVSSIHVNDESAMIVRSNCAYVLCQAHWHDPSSSYWIDAICIDQTNDAEKSQQVQMMGAIYQRASQVLVCVGPHDGDSEFLVRFVRTHQERLLDFTTYIQDDNGARFAPLAPVPRRLRLAKSVAWRLRNSMRTHERVLTALAELLSRDYFQRAWVAQELYMGTETLLYCGSVSCHFPALEGLLAISLHDDAFDRDDIMARLGRPPTRRSYRMVDRMLCSSIRMCETKFDIGFLRKRAGMLKLARAAQDQSLSMTELLFGTRELKCAIALDSIYAMLSMMQPSTAQQIVVDYNDTAFNLASHSMALMTNELGDTSGRIANSAVSDLYYLTVVLQVRPEDPAFVAAVDARMGPGNAPSQSQPLISRNSTPLYITGWAGHQLSHTDSGWLFMRATSTRDTMLSTPDQDLPITTIRTPSGAIATFMTSRVRIGDWIVKSNCGTASYAGWDPGLILRETVNERLEIVGAAAWLAAPSDEEMTRVFDVRFDPTDFSTLICSFRFLLVEDRRMLQIQSAQPLE
nr:hypothetical protein B0A51_00163 [Rachicladosporium sp. CCFEE 5018]